MTLADYAVAVYIYGNSADVSGSSTKPTSGAPLTTIGADGTWTCDITTAGQTRRRHASRPTLIPKTYDPPRISGEPTLPPDLEANAVAKAVVDRVRRGGRRRGGSTLPSAIAVVVAGTLSPARLPLPFVGRHSCLPTLTSLGAH